MTDTNRTIGINFKVNENSKKEFTEQAKKAIKEAAKATDKVMFGKQGIAGVKKQRDDARADRKRIADLKKELDLQKQIAKEAEKAARVKERQERRDAFRKKVRDTFEEKGVFGLAGMAGRSIAGGAKAMGSGAMGMLKGLGGLGMSALRGAGGMLSSGLNMLAGPIMGMLSSAFQFGIDRIQRGVESYDQFDQSRASLSHLVGRRGYTPQMINEKLKAGAPYGYSAQDSIEQMRGLARATGGIGLLQDIQATSRTTGMDIGEMTGFSGTLTRAGNQMKGEKGRRQFARILKDAVSTGLDDSRVGEHFDAVANMVQATAETEAGEVNTSQISGLLRNISGLGAGFQGARGAGFLTKFDTALKGGGGGDAEKAFMLQSMGFGTPGGGTSFYDALKKMQRGIFGKGGAENFAALLQHAETVGGGGEETNYLLNKLTGATLDQIETFRAAFSGGGIAGLQRALDAEGDPERDVQQRLVDGVRTFTEGARIQANLNNRLVQIGEDNIESVRQMRSAINDLADQTIVPLMTDAFRLIVDVIAPGIRTMADWLSGIFGTLREFINSLRSVLHMDSAEPSQEQQAETFRKRDELLAVRNSALEHVQGLLERARAQQGGPEAIAEIRKLREQDYAAQSQVISQSGRIGLDPELEAGTTSRLGRSLSELTEALQTWSQKLEQERADNRRANRQHRDAADRRAAAGPVAGSRPSTASVSG